MCRLVWLTPILIAAGLSAGCESLYDDYVQVAAELLLLQVDSDLDDTVTLEAPFDDRYVEARCYLYEARNMDELGSVPAEAATVLLESDSMARRPLQDQGEGYYYLDSTMDDNLRYIAHQEVQLTLYYAGKERIAWFILPDSPNTHVPTEHQAGQAMELSLDPPDFDGALSLVLDQDGSLLVDERPTSLEELLAITEMGETGSVSIPGSAFPTPPRPQAVGVGGVRITRGTENFENMDNEDCRMAAASIELSLVDVW
jgi:hypothetical protein